MFDKGLSFGIFILSGYIFTLSGDHGVTNRPPQRIFEWWPNELYELGCNTTLASVDFVFIECNVLLTVSTSKLQVASDNFDFIECNVLVTVSTSKLQYHRA